MELLIMKKDYNTFKKKQQGRKILHSCQQCWRVLVAPHLYPHSVFLIFYSGGYIVLSHCGFNFYFPNG